MTIQNVDTNDLDIDVRPVSPHCIVPYHGVASEDRYETIKSSLSQNGWDGYPIVVYDDFALGGAHRIAAARDLDMDIPVVEIEDLIRAAGEDPSDYDINDSEDAIEALGIVPGISVFA